MGHLGRAPSVHFSTSNVAMLPHDSRHPRLARSLFPCPWRDGEPSIPSRVFDLGPFVFHRPLVAGENNIYPSEGIEQRRAR